MPGLSKPPCRQSPLLLPSRGCSLAVLLAVPLSCLATDYPPPPGPYPVGPLTSIAAPPAADAGSATENTDSSGTPGTTGPNLIGLSDDDLGATANPYGASVLFGAPPQAAAQSERPPAERPATMMPPVITDYGYTDPAPPPYADERGFPMDLSRDRRQPDPGGTFEQVAPPYADYARPDTAPMHYDSRAAAISPPGYAPGYGPQYAPGPGYDYGNGYAGRGAPGVIDRGYAEQGYPDQGYGGYAGYPEGYYDPGHAPPSARADMPVAPYPSPTGGSMTPRPAPAPGADDTGATPPDMRFRPPELLPQ